MAYKRNNSNKKYVAKTVEKNDTNETIENVVMTKSEEPKVENKVVTKVEYNGDDLIPCRSMTKGELVYIGKKSKETYIWADYGDITEVEYQDLLALKSAKSIFIFDALFIIEDEDLLNDPKWKEVKATYDKIYSDDVNTLINMDTNKFKRAFPNLPKGLQKAVITEIATQMEAGTFDSIQKIKLVDELCNTDLAAML